MLVHSPPFVRGVIPALLVLCLSLCLLFQNSLHLSGTVFLLEQLDDTKIGHFLKMLSNLAEINYDSHILAGTTKQRWLRLVNLLQPPLRPLQEVEPVKATIQHLVEDELVTAVALSAENDVVTEVAFTKYLLGASLRYNRPCI